MQGHWSPAIPKKEEPALQQPSWETDPSECFSSRLLLWENQLGGEHPLPVQTTVSTNLPECSLTPSLTVGSRSFSPRAHGSSSTCSTAGAAASQQSASLHTVLQVRTAEEWFHIYRSIFMHQRLQETPSVSCLHGAGPSTSLLISGNYLDFKSCHGNYTDLRWSGSSDSKQEGYMWKTVT